MSKEVDRLEKMLRDIQSEGDGILKVFYFYAAHLFDYEDNILLQFKVL